MSSHADPDTVDRAAAICRASADEVHLIYEPLVPLLGVNFAGRIAVFVLSLPWLRILAVLTTVLCLLAGWVKFNHVKLVARFDAFVTKTVLTKMRAKLVCDVQIDAVRLRPGATPMTATATVEGFRMGNPPTGAFNAPFLVSMERVLVRCNPFSLAGLRGRGNFVVGWIFGEVELVAVHGAVVYIDEVFDQEKRQKIRNFQGISRQTVAQLAEEIDREEEALKATQEEKRLAEEAAAALKEKNIEVKEASFFSSVTDTFSAAQAEIEKELQEVTTQAAALPGNISSGIQSAEAEVTNKLNALITLLERVNQKPQEETEEEKRRKRKLILSVEHLTFTEWNIHILAVSEKAFKFKSWDLEKFTGKVGALTRECATGLLNQIITDFQQEILDSLKKNISAVGEGLLSIGGSVVGGVAGGGNMVLGGVTKTGKAIGKGISDTGGVIGKELSGTGQAVVGGVAEGGNMVLGGVTYTGDVIGNGVSDTGEAIGKGLGSVSGGVAEGGNMVLGGVTDTGEAIGKGVSDTGEATGKGLSGTGQAIGKVLSDTGGSVACGVSEGGNMALGGVTDTGKAIGKGVSDTGEAIGEGLSSTGQAIGKGLSGTGQAVGGVFGLLSVVEEPKKEEAASEA